MNLRCGSGGDSGFTLENNDTISEISGHDEIVLDDESSLLCVKDESLDDLASNDTLFGVQETRKDMTESD